MVRQDFADELRRWRDARGLSVRALSSRVPISKSQISAYENGILPVDAADVVPLDRELGADGRLLRVFEQVRADSRHVKEPFDEQPRVWAAAPEGGQPIDGAAIDSDRWDWTLQHPERADLVTAAMLRQELHDLEHAYHGTASTTLLAVAGERASRITYLRRHASSHLMLRELLGAEATAETLMGQLVWDASDRRDHATALGYYDRALEIAQRLGDPAAEGKVLLRQSYVALYGTRNPKRGRELADQAAATSCRASRALDGLALLHRAEADAMLGDGKACDQALADGQHRLAGIDAADPAANLASPEQHDRLAGSCYLSLNRLAQAETTLERAAACAPAGRKSVSIVWGNLALTQARQHRPDEAAASVHHALDVLEAVRAGGGLTVVFAAVRELAPWRGQSTVHDVHDRLFALMTSA